MAFLQNFSVLSPGEFRDMTAAGEEKGEAYGEFLRNCRALDLKANTALSQYADTILSGALVDLSRNYVGGAGLQAMTTLLARNPNLQELRLPSNGLHNDAVVFFCRSMKQHPTLSSIDFTNNNAISLAGGLALLSLAQHRPLLTHVDLTDTQVPMAVLKKMDQALRLNRAASAGAVASAIARDKRSAAVEPTWRMVGAPAPVLEAAGERQAAAPPRTSPMPATAAVAIAANDDTTHTSKDDREAARAAVWQQREERKLEALRARVVEELAQGSTALPPAAPISGWRVLEVAILAPPCIFASEVELLVQRVFPRLNAELQSRRTVLLPLVNPQAPVPASSKSAASVTETGMAAAGSFLRHVYLSAACDVVADVMRSRFVTVELLGDRAGEVEQAPAAVMLRGIPANGLVTLNGTEGAGRKGEEAKVGGRGGAADGPALRPVLYTAHEEALQHSRWVIVATRRDTKRMGVPPSLAPLLSSEPSIEHPDQHRPVVRSTITGNTLCRPNTTDTLTKTTVQAGDEGTVTATTTSVTVTAMPCHRIGSDYAVEEQRWREHVEFKAHVLATVPAPELIIEDYKATFASTGEHGRIFIDDLEEFSEAIYGRLRILLDASLPVPAAVITDSFVGETAYRKHLLRRTCQRLTDSTFIQTASLSAIQKKSVSSRVNLYVVTPPSRNSLILHGADTISLTSVLNTCAMRLLAMPYAYTVAVHSARFASTREEPTDLRDVITHVLSQLTLSEEVHRYLHTEVDIHRLRRFFVDYISSSNSSSGGGGGAQGGMSVSDGSVGPAEGPHLVILLDGVDAVDPPVEPCIALRLSEDTGVDVWDGVGDARSGGAATTEGEAAAATLKAVAEADGMSKKARARLAAGAAAAGVQFIPTCLARNVRIVGTCLSSSERIASLEGRGRDGVELLTIGPCSANDVEQMLSPVALGRLGVELSDDDFVLARDKTDAHLPEYLHYLIDALRSQHEVPSYESQTHMLADFPGTLAEAAQRVYDTLHATFGSPMTFKVTGLLSVARWGISETELRAVLQLPPRRFNELLRVLRPVLEPSGTEMCGNALASRVRLSAQSFIDVLAHSQLWLDCGSSEADRAVWHEMLARHYLAVVQSAVAAERGSVLRYTRSPTSAYEREAVKEVAYHLAQANLWQQFDRTVLSIPFMILVFRNELAYHFTRDLISSFNLRYKRYLVGEDVGGSCVAAPATASSRAPSAKDDRGAKVGRQHLSPSTESLNATSISAQSLVGRAELSRRLPIGLSRLRDYVYFARTHSARLVEYPHLVAQTAVERAEGAGFVQLDAKEYLRKQFHQMEYNRALEREGAREECALERSVFFEVTNARRMKLHLGAIVSAQFSANGKYIFTGSNDRSVCWVTPETGAAIFYGRQSTSRVRRVAVSETSAYAAAVTEDRMVYLYDAALGKLISRNTGELFTSPISSCVFSARGRYYFVATDDLTVRVFSTEKGNLQTTLKASDLLVCTVGGGQLRDDDDGDGDDKEDFAARAASPGAPAVGDSIHVKRNYIVVLADPSDDEEFLTIANEDVRRWRMNNSRDAAEPVVTLLFSVTGSARMAQWCSQPVDPNDPALGDEAAVARRQSGHALTQPVDRSCVCLMDMHRGCVVSRFRLVEPDGEDDMASAQDSYSRVGSGGTEKSCGGAEARATSLSRVKDFAVSPDHRWIALAACSGTVSVYPIEWSRIMSAAASTPGVAALSPRPTVVFDAFAHATIPDVIGLAFRHDSSAIFALGNLRQLKYWNLQASGLAASDSVPQETGQYVKGCRVVETNGEFLMDNEATCWSVSTCATRGVEVAIGDVAGQISLLSLWSPC